MPRVPKSPVTLVYFAYKAWSRLPPAQRRRLLQAARTHGPTLVGKAAAVTRKAAAARRAGR